MLDEVAVDLYPSIPLSVPINSSPFWLLIAKDVILLRKSYCKLAATLELELTFS